MRAETRFAAMGSEVHIVVAGDDGTPIASAGLGRFLVEEVSA